MCEGTLHEHNCQVSYEEFEKCKRYSWNTRFSQPFANGEFVLVCPGFQRFSEGLHCFLYLPIMRDVHGQEIRDQNLSSSEYKKPTEQRSRLKRHLLAVTISTLADVGKIRGASYIVNQGMTSHISKSVYERLPWSLVTYIRWIMIGPDYNTFTKFQICQGLETGSVSEISLTPDKGY